MTGFRLDFAGVGVPKAATTWISDCLEEHPQVCFGLDKELNYFITEHPLPDTSTNRELGTDWFNSRFSHRKPGQVLGEFSPVYFSHSSTPDLLHQHNPEMKLIINLRNPIDALYSYYFTLGLNRRVPDCFEDFIAGFPALTGLYSYHNNVLNFMRLFQRKQMHFIVFEDIQTDPVRVFQHTCRFLEIDDRYNPPTLLKRVAMRKTVRSRLVRDTVGGMVSWLNSSERAKNIKHFLRKFGLHHIANLSYRLNRRPTLYIPMKPETRAQLIETFRKENRLIGAFLGRDFSHWNE